MEKIKISNFRKIKDTWDLDLAPITFFTGKNNSGKSSILKALMVLSDFSNSTNHFELTFNGENKDEHKIKNFSNAVNWKNRAASNLEFDFLSDGYSFSLIFNPIISPFQGKNDNGQFLTGELFSLKINRIEDNALLEITQNPSGYQITLDDSYLIKNFQDGASKAEIKQLEEALAQIDIELDKVEKEIKEKLTKNPSLLASLGVSSTAGISSLTLSSILTGPLMLAGAGAAAIFSHSKGRDLISLKKKAEGLQANKKNAQKKLSELLNKKSHNRKGRNFLRPEITMEELPKSGLTIDAVLRNKILQYLITNEKKLGKSNKKEDSEIVFGFADDILKALKFDVHHLSPNRNRQTRLYYNANKDSDINEILEEYNETPLPRGSKERTFLLKWLELLEIGVDYRITNIAGQANTVEIFEKKPSSNEEKGEDLVDKGFGAGQLFTILLQIAMATSHKGEEESPLLLIEEPESNLHPKLQSNLAELFLDAYSTLGVRFIIETHSEYVIRKTQLVGLDKNFFTEENQEKNPFKVYYFGSEGPYEMKYTSQGRFERDFGKGFYDVAAKLNMETLKKSRQNK